MNSVFEGTRVSRRPAVVRDESKLRLDYCTEYKVIYICEIPDIRHAGLVKVGDATLKGTATPDQYPDNCAALNAAAKERINEWTRTAGLTYNLLYTSLAVREIRDESGRPRLLALRDGAAHRALNAMGIYKEDMDTGGREWFRTDWRTAKNAVLISRGMIPTNLEVAEKEEIVLRDEQEEAVKFAMEKFRAGKKRVLWNCKMRFGKTFTALALVKRMKLGKVLILTHRPVVNDGWKKAFPDILDPCEYAYGSRKDFPDFSYFLDRYVNGRKYIYFASMQDLRGSDAAGGSFAKNEDVFGNNWDLVIVDEAHEGTRTELGLNVLALLDRHGNCRRLELSGTPFNLLEDYDPECVFSWDYIQEQKRRREWNSTHFGDVNPYEDLPELRIFTYDLGELGFGSKYQDIVDKAFNFAEFFRVWTGDPQRDGRIVNPSEVGKFKYAGDVLKFLDLMCREDEKSNYPYSTAQWRETFRHSLWVVPGVKEAKALCAMLENHPVFGKFRIVNVAGSDNEWECGDALQEVKTAVRDNEYTVTVTCGRLTTGVTVPEWTAVMMLAGSYSTSAMQYMQTIFRVQTPYNAPDGRAKRLCFAFDFAPDRTLKMVAEAAACGRKDKDSGDRGEERRAIGEFLNFCPVISITGSGAKEYDTGELLRQLKRAQARKVVEHGFEDNRLFNLAELRKLDPKALKLFNDLKGIVGKNGTGNVDVILNAEGLDQEQTGAASDRKKTAKPKKTLSREEKERRDNLKTTLSVLRAVAVRIPLLLYGAPQQFEQDITLGKLPELVDDESWLEFMPAGVTKPRFREMRRYFDLDVFVEAGRQIRSLAKQADLLPPLPRAAEIARLMGTFKNPDKETVLTPWRVVNMHLCDCLGGLNFYDDKYEKPLEEPRWIDRDEVTGAVFGGKNPRILEINSKTGLYPLYAACSLFYALCRDYPGSENDPEWIELFWRQAVEENVFVLCRTKMARSITRRTLVGYNTGIRPNAVYYGNMLGELQRSSDKFVQNVSSPSFWGKDLDNMKTLKFDAVVGNPPYQISDGGNGASAKPLYHHFVSAAKRLNPRFFSLIIPARWYSGGKGLDDFRAEMLNDKRIKSLNDYFDSTVCFPGVDISGGICYFLWEKNYDGKCKIVSHFSGKDNEMERHLLEPGAQSFIRFNEAVGIIRKVSAKKEASFADLVSARKPFGLATNVKVSKKASADSVKIYAYPDCGYYRRDIIVKGIQLIDKWKVYIAKAYGERGSFPYMVIGKPFIGEPESVCSETYLVVGNDFSGRRQADNVISYMKTRFFRFLILLKKNTQDATSQVYDFVPVQDFSKPWTDAELYAKYKLTPKEIAFIESMIRPME